MTTLITGAGGFVGRHALRSLEAVPLELEGQRVDLREPARVLEAVRRIRPSQVLHLAAQSHVPTSFADPDATFQTNFWGTLNLLRSLKATGFQGTLLYVGSGETYGLVPAQALPIREEQPQRPRNPYAVSKVAAEALCYQWSQTEGLRVVLARPFNHVGPGQRPDFVVAELARQVARIRQGRQEPCLRTGNLDVTRDFTDVRDVVRAYALLLSRGASGEVYNVCSGQERQLRAIAQDLLRLAGVQAEIQGDPARQRPAEQPRVVASFAKLQAATDWAPQIPWATSLADVLAYWAEQPAGAEATR